MHKHTKLTPTLRKEAYRKWCTGNYSYRELAKSYHVDKNIIHIAILRGRLGDFSVHDSTNHRYRTIEYGLGRLWKTEKSIEKRFARQAIRRYERSTPGELLHGDNKRLWYLPGETKTSTCREVLFVAIDDCTRWLVADILPSKTMWSSSLFLETTLLRLPFRVECHYSDNGTEYKGPPSHAFPAMCARYGIDQQFTKIRHPWTNGKAERVIRTLMEEWYRVNRFKDRDDRRRSLYQFVDWYNHHRPHLGLKGFTPAEKLASLAQTGDNA
jgi:transposase InsO family protein